MLPSHERAFLYRYLSYTLERGITPKEALASYLEDMHEIPRYKKKLNKALALLTKKQRLHEILFSLKLISQDEYAILRDSYEYKLSYPQTLLKLSEQTGKQSMLERKIKGVMLYPLILIIELVTILFLAVFWLIPHFQSFFDALHITSPIPLKLILKVVHVTSILFSLQNSYWLILIIGLAYIVYSLFKKDRVQYQFDRLKITFFKIGALYRLFLIQKIFSHLGFIMNSSSPIPFHEALFKAGASAKNHVYQKELCNLAQELKNNGHLPTLLKHKAYKKLFPKTVRRLLIIGYRHNTLSSEIQELGTFLQEEFEIELKHLVSLIEPVLIIAIAVILTLLGITLQNIISELEQAIVFM